MNRLIVPGFVCSCLLFALPALSEPVAGASANGTWDCAAETGEVTGAIVIAGTSYAQMLPTGKVGGYGEVKFIAEADVDLPTFVFMSGVMKDELASPGGAMRGPKDHPHDLSGEHFMQIVLPEGKMLDCRRRKAPPG